MADESAKAKPDDLSRNEIVAAIAYNVQAITDDVPREEFLRRVKRIKQLADLLLGE